MGSACERLEKSKLLKRDPTTDALRESGGEEGLYERYVPSKGSRATGWSREQQSRGIF